MAYIIRPQDVEDGCYDTIYAFSSEDKKQLFFRVTLTKDRFGISGKLSYFVKHKGEIIFTTDHLIQALNKFNSISIERSTIVDNVKHKRLIDLDLSVRALNALEACNVITVDELLQLVSNEKKYKMCRYIGPKTREEISTLLKELGL